MTQHGKHSREHYARRYQRRIERGLCVKCVRNAPREGKRTCQSCEDKRKTHWPKQCKRAKERRQTRKAAGLCIDCGKSPFAADSITRCSACLESKRAYGKRTNYASTKKWFSRNRHRQKGYWLIGKNRLREEVFSHYGGSQCACCGDSILDFLSLDHIDGGGTKHRKSLKSKGTGHNFYRWIKQQGFPSGYRVLCHNCNKAVSHGRTCPHQIQLNDLADRLVSACG